MVSFFAGFAQNITNLLKYRRTKFSKYENLELYFVAEGHLVFLNFKLK